MSFPRQYRHTITGRASAAGDEARARLLEVALELFATAGLRGTSVAQVATRAGLSQAAFDALVDLVSRTAQRPHVVRLFVTLGAEALDPEHPAHPWVQAHYDSLERWLTAAVEHGRDRGEFRADTPVTTLVRLTIAAMDGLQIQWLVGGMRFDMAAEFRHVVDAQRHAWQS